MKQLILSQGDADVKGTFAATATFIYFFYVLFFVFHYCVVQSGVSIRPESVFTTKIEVSLVSPFCKFANKCII